MLRLLLPPNLPAAATRDAIPVKAEINLQAEPAPELLPALAALQRFGAKPAPVLFLQLSRSQLRELISLLRGQPVFAWVNAPAKPLLWVGPLLRGASEHLADPAPAADSTPPAGSADPSPVGRASRPTLPNPVGRALRPTSSYTPLTVDGSEHYLAITLPSRESAAYEAALELLKEHGFRLEPSNRKWWLRDRHKALNFLAQHLETLRKEFHAEFTPNFERQTSRLKFAEIATEVIEARDGFEVTVGLRAGRAAETALQTALASGRGYVEDHGAIFLIDRTQLARVAAAQAALAGEPAAGGAGRRTHRVAAARVSEVQDVLEELAPDFQAPATWRSRADAMRNVSQLPPAPIPDVLNNLLRPYQRLGTAWLWYLYHHQLGGILADEMGLGKTLQALALLAALHAPRGSEGESGRGSGSGFTPDTARPLELQLPTSTDARSASLVVAPASLVENWRREAARFAPQLRTFVHHGERRLASREALAGIDVVITSYGTLTRDEDFFRDLDFRTVIADEAQHIKNRRTRNARALRSLGTRGRFLLTGTPLENSLDDLRSLFEFLMPGFLQPLPSGLKSDERAWHDERLRAQTAPYILRRTKAAVAPELPEKIEQVIYCDLEPKQASLYRRIQEESERALFDLEASGASQNAVRLATLTQLLRLRQVCVDPRLIPAGRSQPLTGQTDEDTGPGSDSVTPSYADSAKLGAFRELLDEALDEEHRVLVFSQFTSLLALLRDELDRTGIQYAYLDGSMAPRERQAAVDRFQSDASIPLFLLSLKAGGTGLNLTGADTVVHFDPWWNPAVETQATDRAHRIGQSRVVTSYKLICSGTVEEKVLALQDSKRALLADVFDASDTAAAKLGLDDLKDLLRA
jgi:superfamily II DNA or RNA helicase